VVKGTTRCPSSAARLLISFPSFLPFSVSPSNFFAQVWFSGADLERPPPGLKSAVAIHGAPTRAEPVTQLHPPFVHLFFFSPFFPRRIPPVGVVRLFFCWTTSLHTLLSSHNQQMRSADLCPAYFFLLPFPSLSRPSCCCWFCTSRY